MTMTANEMKKMFKDQLKDQVDVKWAVLFMDPDTYNLVHMVGYEANPSIADLRHLFEELVTDEELRLEKEYFDTLKMAIYCINADSEVTSTGVQQ